MSPPPWTLFWPRSGLRPLPHRPDVPAQQREVDQREDVVDRVVVLGDAQGPADHRPARPSRRRGPSRGSPPRGRRSRAPRTRGVYGSTAARYASKPAGRAPDELLVREARGDDLAAHRVRQRDVGAHVQAQPQVGPLARTSSGAGRPRTAGRRCAPPSGGGGRRSGASPGRCCPTGGRRPSPRSHDMSWYRHQRRTRSPDRRQRGRVRCGCSCRCCCCPGRPGRASGPRS